MPAKGRLQDTGDSQALLTSYLLGDDDVTVRLVVNFRSSMPAPSLGSFCYWSPWGGCSKARFSNTGVTTERPLEGFPEFPARGRGSVSVCVTVMLSLLALFLFRLNCRQTRD